MATEIAKAYVQLIPSAEGIQGKMENLLGGEAKSAGLSLGGMLGGNLVKVLGGVITAAGIGKVISDSIQQGAKLEQSLGGVETLFKDSADTVVKNAKEAYKTAGMDANTYMETVTGFSASLLQSLGGDTQKAAKQSDMAIRDMSDNANKFGTNIQDIQNAYQGFAKQNYTMLDNLKLGYGGTKKEMERLLEDATKISGIEYNIDSLSDVYDAIHVIQNEMGVTGTTAKEASETFSGSFDSMKAAALNFLGDLALGEDVGPALEALTETTLTFLLDNFLPMIGNIVKSIPDVVSTAIKVILPRLKTVGQDILKNLTDGSLSQAPAMLSNFIEIFQGVLDSITANLPEFLNKGVEILTNIANGILQAIPGLLSIATDVVIGFAQFIFQNLPTILQAGADLLLNLVTGIANNLPAIGQSAIDAIAKFISFLVTEFPKLVENGKEILTNLISGITEKLPEIDESAAEIITKIINKFVELWPDIVQAGADIISSLIDGLESMVKDILTSIGKMGSEIIEEFKSIDLKEAGKAIINGFIDGLKQTWEDGKRFIGGIGQWIKDNKGPLDYDRKLLIPAGKAIMGGLNTSLKDGFKPVKRTVLSVSDMIQDTLNDTFSKEYSGSILATVGIDDSVQDDLNRLTVAQAQLDQQHLLSSQIQLRDDTQEKNFMYETLENIVSGVSKLVAKDTNSYLDRAKVSRELNDPLTKQQQIREVTLNRMGGNY
ncbi:phage tail protein [Globicatella sanguinis]|uniref:phage tail protein n=1 Tax=Globicatella sanguinis TaxID=13076 RepID=UPI0008264C00|nr:hypothetical protein [Globicatella sanguinis]